MVPDAQKPRLLIVDDDPAVLDALCVTLRLQDYEVTGLSSAYEAVEAVTPGRFDLLLSDLSLPGMTGLELLDEARRRDPALRCVLMTGASADVAALRATDAGVTNWVTKPVTLRELTPVLARALKS